MDKPQYTEGALVGQALASPIRLRALNLLAQRSWTVSELAAALGISKMLASSHLKQLKQAGLVEQKRHGREVWCQLASDTVPPLLVALRRATEAVSPELRRLAAEAGGDRFAAGDIDPVELSENASRGAISLIDLRPESEYAAGHLPHAVSLPTDRIGRLAIRALPKDLKTYAYCRGPYCAKADEGVRRLHRIGLQAKRLDIGVVDWLAKGLSLEKASPQDASLNN